MIWWRISNHATLDGLGGLRASGRWSLRGRPVVYCAPDPATALLETLVHLELDREDIPEAFQWLRIEVPDDVPMETVDLTTLPDGGLRHQARTQRLGDKWLAELSSAILRVPSILVPETYNALLNPRHPAATRCVISAVYRYPLDARLLGNRLTPTS
ncbi:RES family NAD+ phosphorylase [Acidithiobacillus sp.]